MYVIQFLIIVIFLPISFLGFLDFTSTWLGVSSHLFEIKGKFSHADK